MNILIPDSWLREHLDTKVDPNGIRAKVSLCGPSIERIYDKDGESVYDIEVTTNRVDSMCVRGIAREAAAILKQFGESAKLKPLSLPKVGENSGEKSARSLPLPKIVNDPKLCGRILCVVLDEVKLAKTPAQMAQRLTHADHTIHHAAIDITNYVTHELGHPCHAFDYDKVMKLGGVIKVVEAQAGKKFVTLDDEKFTTVGGEVVFENDQGEIIDLPSIKGTANSSIDDHTKRILFLIESIRPEKIRFASMTHAIRSTAAQLNEKHVDPHLADDTLKLAVKLYQEICGAKVASEVYDDFPAKKAQSTVVKTKLSQITTYLGEELATKTISELLTDLDFEVTIADGVVEVKAPTFRPDINISQDVIEEIARLYGYHNLGNELMSGVIPTTYPAETDFDKEYKVQVFLAGRGWQEVYTYSMVGEDVALQSGQPKDKHIKIANPLTSDREYMRLSLVPSHEEVLVNNKNVSNISIFEIANTYLPNGSDLPIQNMHLTLTTNREYSWLTSELSSLFMALFVPSYQVVMSETQESPFAQAGSILAGPADNQQLIGHIGITKLGHSSAEINLGALWSVSRNHPRLVSKPNTAEVKEDLTFTLPVGVSVGEVVTFIKQSESKLQQVMVSSTYRQNITFSVIFQDPTSNLTAAQVSEIRGELIAKVEKQFNAQLVGQK